MNIYKEHAILLQISELALHETYWLKKDEIVGLAGVRRLAPKRAKAR
jgi:hypothetical protein